MDTPIVSVIVLTYNQDGYIRQCIDSVLSQRTNYHFEIGGKNYDRIQTYWKQSSNMTGIRHELFPKELGPFEDDPYFAQYVNHALLKAAYENNDFKSAKEYARIDPAKGLAVKMACCKVSFFF